MWSGKIRLRARKILFCALFWCGLLVLGLLMIPAGILYGIHYLLGEALDFLLEKAGGN